MRSTVTAPVRRPSRDRSTTNEPSSEPSTRTSSDGGIKLTHEGIDLREHLAGIEIALIRQALARADGVVAHAAKILKLQRTTLVEKLRKYGIFRDGGESVEAAGF